MKLRRWNFHALCNKLIRSSFDIDWSVTIDIFEVISVAFSNRRTISCCSYLSFFSLSWRTSCATMQATVDSVVLETKRKATRNITSCSFCSQKAICVKTTKFIPMFHPTTPMTQMKKMAPTTIYRPYRRNSFFRRRRFLRF